MYSIDEIMEMLDSSLERNNSCEIQKQGIELGKKIKCLDVFFQPVYPSGKLVWENCAKIIVSKTDEELEPYIFKMFEWLDDINWPGALIIFERLVKMKNKEKYQLYRNLYLSTKKNLHDESAIENFIEYEKMYIEAQNK